MGCICIREKKKQTKSEEAEIPTKKTYSWEARKEINLSNYIIESIENKEILRCPESVNGEQFLIQNCKNSFIYILDFINTVTIEDCENCTIVLGPVKASVYVRNCVASVFVTACGQFRTRDCRKCLIFVHCATQPIIESSTGMKFGTFQLNYDLLDSQLLKAELNLSINTWTEIYDFTPIEGDSNWSFIEAVSSNAVLKARSRGMETSLNELKATWLGKPAVNIAVESSV